MLPPGQASRTSPGASRLSGSSVTVPARASSSRSRVGRISSITDGATRSVTCFSWVRAGKICSSTACTSAAPWRAHNAGNSDARIVSIVRAVSIATACTCAAAVSCMASIASPSRDRACVRWC